MRIQRTLFVLLVAASSSSCSMAGDVLSDYGLNNPTANTPLFRSITDRRKQELSEAQQVAPIPEKTSTFQKLAQRIAPKKEDEVETSAEWVDPLVTFCDTNNSEWMLNDADLKMSASFSLGKDDALRQRVFNVRGAVQNEWNAWFTSDKKEEAYATLRARYEQELKKQKVVSNDKLNQFAEWTVMADVSNLDFTQQMLQSMKGGAYYSLVLFVLGFPYWSQDKKPARVINGVRLTDAATLERILALVVTAYRHMYDSVFAAAYISQGLTFTRESSEAASFFIEKARSEYMGIALASNQFDSRWQAIIAAARAQAHKTARDFVQGKLSRVIQLLTYVYARLEVVRVTDAAFSYPDSSLASHALLIGQTVQSILLGLVYRSSEQILTNNEFILSPEQIQSFFVREYQGQQEMGHISATVPAGELINKNSSDDQRKQRRAFEVRCALLFGNVDFLRQGSYDPEVQQALEAFDISKGAELYKKLVLLYCQQNGIEWGILPTSKKQNSKVLFKQLLGSVALYLKELQLDVGTPQDIAGSFAKLVSATDSWSEKERTLFSLRSSVSISGSGKAKVSRVICSADVYQALYKFFWLCVGRRLLIVAARGDSQKKTLGDDDQEEDAVAQENVLELQKQAAQKVAESEKQDDVDNGLSGSLLKAHKKVAQFGDTLEVRAERIKSNTLKFVTGESGAVEMNTDIVNSLSDTTKFIGGLQEVMEGLFKQSENASTRLIATFKAVLIYTHSVSEFAKKKIENAQKVMKEGLSYLNNPAIGWAVRKAIGSGIKKTLTEVNKDDEVLIARIRQAGADMQLAMQGKKKPNDLKLVLSNGTVS